MDEDREDQRQDLSWQLSFEGRRILGAEHDALLIRIEEEEILEAVAFLLPKLRPNFRKRRRRRRPLNTSVICLSSIKASPKGSFS